MAVHHELSDYPLAGGIAFIVRRGVQNGMPIAVTHHAMRLFQATPARDVTFIGIEAEIRRIALREGAVLEPT